MTIKEKYGFIDKNGKLVVPIIYDLASHFENGLALVLKDGYYGFIDNMGGIRIPLIYDHISGFIDFKTGCYRIISEGLICAQKGNMYGFIDTNGRTVIPFVYTRGCYFDNGFAVVHKEDESYIIDVNGNVKYKCLYPDFLQNHYAEGMFLIRRSDGGYGKYGIINQDGRIVVPIEDHFCFDVCSEGLIVVKKRIDGEIRSGFFNKNGQLVIPYEFEWACPFENGLARVERHKKWGYIDKNGNVIVSYDYYDRVWPFSSDGYSPVCKNRKWGYVNRRGEEIIPLEYDYASPFSDGLALVNKNWKAYIINKDGKIKKR